MAGLMAQVKPFTYHKYNIRYIARCVLTAIMLSCIIIYDDRICLRRGVLGNNEYNARCLCRDRLRSRWPQPNCLLPLAQSVVATGRRCTCRDASQCKLPSQNCNIHEPHISLFLLHVLTY